MNIQYEFINIHLISFLKFELYGYSAGSATLWITSQQIVEIIRK
jgi:hypothetical protein